MSKRTYQGVYLDVKEDIEYANEIGAAADRAMASVDAETVALYAKYNMLDQLPERLRSSGPSPWITPRGPKVVAQPKNETRELIREWDKRLMEYR